MFSMFQNAGFEIFMYMSPKDVVNFFAMQVMGVVKSARRFGVRDGGLHYQVARRGTSSSARGDLSSHPSIPWMGRGVYKGDPVRGG